MLRLPFIIILLFISAFLFSQNIGVRGAINFSDFSVSINDPSVDTGIKTGYDLGVFLNLRLGHKLSLQPELHYLIKGTNGDTSQISLDLFEVPILVKYSFNTPGFVPYIIGGPSLGYALNATLTDGQGDSDIEFGDNGFRRTEVSWIVGLGLEFGKIFVDARYFFGITDISKELPEARTIKNRVFQLGGGLRF